MAEPLDEHLQALMDAMRSHLNTIGPDLYNDAEMRCLIVATNLKGLANALLEAEDSNHPLPTSRVVLGLFGTAEWLEGDLSERLG